MVDNGDRPGGWMTVIQIAQRLKCSPKTVYAEIAAGRLRAAKIGGRRSMRILPEWADEYLIASSTPVEVVPRASRERKRPPASRKQTRERPAAG
jgi:excisionase family DNA binding protein